MENRVNSQVGRVMVVKVMAQYRTLGTTWKRKRKRRPINAAIEKEATGETGDVRGDEMDGQDEGLEDRSAQAVTDRELYTGSGVTGSVEDGEFSEGTAS